MPKGYWIAHLDVSDPEKYKQYVSLNGIAFAKYHGKFLVRGGAGEVRAGVLKSRHVVVEFPSYQAAKDCFDSPEYQAANAIRVTASVSDLVIVEGYDG